MMLTGFWAYLNRGQENWRVVGVIFGGVDGYVGP